jgi:hypothetical protein
MKFTTILALFLGVAAATEITASAGIKSAIEGPCVYLDETQAELNY